MNRTIPWLPSFTLRPSKWSVTPEVAGSSPVASAEEPPGNGWVPLEGATPGGSGASGPQAESSKSRFRNILYIDATVIDHADEVAAEDPIVLHEPGLPVVLAEILIEHLRKRVDRFDPCAMVKRSEDFVRQQIVIENACRVKTRFC
jgi:hypothetical protein